MPTGMKQLPVIMVQILSKINSPCNTNMNVDKKYLKNKMLKTIYGYK